MGWKNSFRLHFFIWALRQLRCRRALRTRLKLRTFVLVARTATAPFVRSVIARRDRAIPSLPNAFGGAPIPNAFLFFLHPAKTSQSHFLDLQALSGGINRILFLLSALPVREKLNHCLQEFSADEQQSDYLML